MKGTIPRLGSNCRGPFTMQEGSFGGDHLSDEGSTWRGALANIGTIKKGAFANWRE